MALKFVKRRNRTQLGRKKKWRNMQFNGSFSGNMQPLQRMSSIAIRKTHFNCAAIALQSPSSELKKGEKNIANYDPISEWL